MTSENATTDAQVKLAVRRDFGTTRRLISLARRSESLADLCLFRRRKPAQMLEYLERRRHWRSPAEMPFRLIPAAYYGEYATPLAGGTPELFAITKDVSMRGVGFVHDEPLQTDHAIVSFDLDGCSTSLLLEIRWSNVPRSHIYMSGGRFLGIVGAPDV